MWYKHIRRVTGWVFLGLLAATAFALVLGIVVMLLWNWLMPALFALPEITYLQAVGILILAHLLFKGHNHGKDSHHDHHHGTFFRERIHKKFRYAHHENPAEDTSTEKKDDSSE